MSQEDAVALIKQYTVFVATDQGFGSGISLGRGQVLTAYHVVEDTDEVLVRFPGGRRDRVRVIGADPRRDLALLRSSFADEPAATLGDAVTLRQGAVLLAVGYPRADAIGIADVTVTRGIFSARRQSPDGVWQVQTDTTFNTGNSGGPLADSQGRLVGVVSTGVRGASGLNFAVASDEINAFLSSPLAPPPSPTPLPIRTPTPARPTIDTSQAGQVRYIANTGGDGVRGRSACDDQSGSPGWPEGTAVTIVYARADCPGWFWVQRSASDFSWIRAAYLSANPPPTPTPLPPAASAPARPAPLGLQIRAPLNGAPVSDRVVIQGSQARPTPAGAHIWVLVIAQVDGSRWYPCPREIVAGPDGTWECELVLGSPAGTRHDVRVGVVDDALHAALSRFVTTNPGQPVFADQAPGSLPAGFAEEARLEIIRQ